MRSLFLALPILVTSSYAQTTSLKITDIVVSQFEDGPGLAGTQKMVPGEIVSVRFAVANFKTSGDGKIRLAGHAQVFDSRGTAIAPVDEQSIDSSVRDEDKDFHPRFHFQFQLPSIAPPGNWRVAVDANDIQSSQKAQAETTFPVDGRGVEAAAELTIRGLSFYRGQDDETPLKIAAYRAGDPVWVRFDVTGYKYGEQNAVDVTYDVAVRSAEGKQLFSQENAAAERSQAYYPQPWVPGIFSLTLQPTTRAGIYTVAITARDGIGMKQSVAEGQFKVE